MALARVGKLPLASTPLVSTALERSIPKVIPPLCAAYQAFTLLASTRPRKGGVTYGEWPPSSTARTVRAKDGREMVPRYASCGS